MKIRMFIVVFAIVFCVAGRAGALNLNFPSNPTAGFDALSPMNAKGDLIYGGVAGVATVLVACTDSYLMNWAAGIPNCTNSLDIAFRDVIPEALWRDSNADGIDATDENAFHILANQTGEVADAEVSDWWVESYGTPGDEGDAVVATDQRYSNLQWDGSEYKMYRGVLVRGSTMGQAIAGYEALAVNYNTTIDNQVKETSPSGVDWKTSDVPNGLPIKHLNSDEISDTSTAHLLTAEEVSGCVINNYDSIPEAKEYDFPAAAEGYNFVAVVGLAQNVTYDPNGSEIIYLNGLALAAGNSVTNTAPTIGESITFYTFQITAGAWAWMAKTSDADFVDLGS